MNPLDALFSPPEQRLIATVLSHPEKDFGTVELLNQMGSSRSAGSNVLKRWVESGLLKERRIGNQRRLAANPDFLLYPELRKMALKTVGLAQPLARALAPLAEQLQEAFVFGSVATGKDTSESDIDLVVVGDVDLFTVSPLLDSVEQELGRSIHVNIYSKEEWASDDDPILQSIKRGPRIDLMGELHGAAD
jgi:predicted nucleotidyltransferase